MKRWTLNASAAALAFSPILIAAQERQDRAAEGSEPKTKVEAFLATKGRMVVKDFSPIGKISGRFGSTMELETLTVFEPGHEMQKTRGLRVEITEGGRTERSNASFLDLEELEALANAVTNMQKLAGQWDSAPPEFYSEVIFSTKGDFKLGFYQKGKDRRMFASSGIVGRASFYGETSDLPQLKAMLDKTQEKLKAQ